MRLTSPDGLGDGTLSRPSQAVQPADGGFTKVPCPEFDFVQDFSAGSPETTFTAPVPILGLFRVLDAVEDRRFTYK